MILYVCRYANFNHVTTKTVFKQIDDDCLYYSKNCQRIMEPELNRLTQQPLRAYCEIPGGIDQERSREE